MDAAFPERDKTVHDGLNARRRAFALAYATTSLGNGTAAAIEAGYKPSRARKTASELLRNPRVQARIGEHLERVGITRERVLVRMGSIAFEADMADFEPLITDGVGLEELRRRGVNTQLVKRYKARTRQDETGATVTDHEIELYSAADMLRDLAKVLGLFVERREMVEDLTQRFAGMSEDELLRRAQVARVVPLTLPEQAAAETAPAAER